MLSLNSKFHTGTSEQYASIVDANMDKNESSLVDDIHRE
jgi:hypothetical protein